ncbi:MAG TPA: metalloregulator ArsR/SmtB family transcription factor [Gammaproteobacteria bacterium]|nr:metalloregulator ArsR/SmtB family transcription factor [Gammaproteobacteria bacterium]
MIEQKAAVGVLSALAHEARLSVLRLLLKAGPEGLAAGDISRRLGIPPTALSFHLSRLRQAGLVRGRRSGRQIRYLADFVALRDLTAFLSDQCCEESGFDCSDDCPPRPAAADRKRARKRRAVGS